VIPHVEIVNSLEEALSFRHISVTSEEYAVGKDGKNFFGVMTLDQGIHGAQFALGVRNSHSKAFRLSVVVGMRIVVCSNLMFSGDFNIVLQKHSKNLNVKAGLQKKCGRPGQLSPRVDIERVIRRRHSRETP